MRRLLPILLLAALPAWAQKGDLQPLPPVPPPPQGMEAFDEALEPQVTIVKKETETREEYRIRGKLYMVKVTPPHGVPYYLVDKEGNGQMVRHDGTPDLAVPMWVIKSW